MIPSSDEFVEIVAKSIARNRLYREASTVIQESFGVPTDSITNLSDSIDKIFEKLWVGISEHDEHERNLYREDARAVISAINLKLLTMTQ